MIFAFFFLYRVSEYLRRRNS